MKQILVIAVLMLSLASCTKQASDNLRPKGNSEVASKKGKGNAPITLATTATMTLTHNGDGTFTVDYGGATDAIRVLIRSGDSLSTVSGNLYPTNVQELAPAPVGAFSSYVAANTYYQAVIVTGTEERDANGILGADWVFIYTNVVQ